MKLVALFVILFTAETLAMPFIQFGTAPDGSLASYDITDGRSYHFSAPYNNDVHQGNFAYHHSVPHEQFGTPTAAYVNLHYSTHAPSKHVVKPTIYTKSHEVQHSQSEEKRHKTQVTHSSSLHKTSSEQTHHHDHHVDKLHKHLIHEHFNPHHIHTINRHHHHHNLRKYVKHVRKIQQPVVHKYVHPSKETRFGKSTKSQSEKSVFEHKALPTVYRSAKVVQHKPSFGH